MNITIPDTRWTPYLHIAASLWRYPYSPHFSLVNPFWGIVISRRGGISVYRFNRGGWK